jgi:CDP-diacylglycerol--glycerol-3-phosphate 3-phosphatidyltransferase
VTAPLVRALIRMGITPNTLTTIGAGLVLDTLDGQVAREGAQTTTFGAFYDSTLDRVGDAASFIGVAAYLMYAPDIRWREAAVLTCMVGILAVMLVSYMRARAEGLGLDCKVGVAQRLERILGLGLPTLVVGAGSGGVVLTAIVVVLTLLSIITVGQRFAHVHRATAAVGAK